MHVHVILAYTVATVTAIKAAGTAPSSSGYAPV